MNKIAHVVPYIFPAMCYGGPAKLAYQLAVNQQKEGHDVKILTSDSYNKNRRFSNNEKLELNETISTFFASNAVNSIAYTHRIFTHFGIIKYFFTKLKNYEIFHIHDVYVLPQIILMYFLIILKKRFIISPHGVLDPIRTENKKPIKNLLFQLIKPCFGQAEYIIATSSQEKKQLLEVFPHLENKIKTIWNGVEKPKNVLKKTKSNKIRLLYIGKLHPKKGLTKFIKALSQFPNHESFFELTIAGPDDGDKHKIDRLIASLNLKVSRLNFINEKKKINLYENNDVFIHPSDSEGFSISIIEALSYGLPIFVTKACNFEDEDLINSGFLIKNNDQINIHRGLNKIIENKKEISKLSINARKLFIKKYTISVMTKNIDNILSNSFFGIKIGLLSSDKTFKKSFDLYFPKEFSNLFPKLNSNQRVSIDFKIVKKITNKNKLTKLSNFIRVGNDSLVIKHNYLATETSIVYKFEKNIISQIHIYFKSTIPFELVNFILKNLMKDNLFKQIIKKYIQHPLLLDITNKNNLNSLHASAIEKDGKVIALFGMNSVGKSTLVSDYINNKGYSLFSDNYLLFDENGKTYQYPSHVRLNDRAIENEEHKPTESFGYGKSFISIDLSEKKEARLAEVHILKRGGKNSLKEISKDEAIKLINNLQVIDQEDIHYAATQLKFNQKKDFRLSKNIIFYINTIKNNE